MKKEKGLLRTIYEGISDACYIWRQEMRMMVRDEGVLLFCLVMPLFYPLLYSWIYDNEVVREVPVAVIDESRSALSRQFIREVDASPDVRVAYHVNSIDEARQLVEKQVVHGFYFIPKDFSADVYRQQTTYVSTYVDMAIMLHYKAIYQTAVAVSTAMNKEIQIRQLGNTTARQDQISTQPLNFEEVPIFNPSGGYGNFILPGVLILIIQQTMLLGIGLSAGTAREDNRYQDLVPIQRHYHGTFRIVFGKGLAYLLVYTFMAAYLTIVVPRLFHFVHLAGARELIGILVPYLLACIAFGLMMSCVVRYRENVLLLVVFTSVPFLFLSGAVSWPLSNMPGVWQAVANLFPSTFGVRAFIRMNTMGASLEDCAPEYRALWVQAGLYFLLACGVYRYQIIQSRKHALERLNYLKHRRAARMAAEEH